MLHSCYTQKIQRQLQKCNTIQLQKCGITLLTLDSKLEYMRVNVYLNKKEEEKLNRICKKFKSKSECIKKIIEEYENCVTLDELMLTLSSLEEKIDYIRQRIDGQKHLNRV